MQQRKHDKPIRDDRGVKPFRCLCGSMLARLVPEGVEIKCRRCRRQVIIPLDTGNPSKFGLDTA